MCSNDSDANNNQVQVNKQCDGENYIGTENQSEQNVNGNTNATNINTSTVSTVEIGIQVLNNPLVANDDAATAPPAEIEADLQHDCTIVQHIEQQPSEGIVAEVSSIVSSAVQHSTPVCAIDTPPIISNMPESSTHSNTNSSTDLRSPSPNASIISFADRDETEEDEKLNITQDLFSNLSIIDDAEPEPGNTADNDDNSIIIDRVSNSSNLVIVSFAPQIAKDLKVELPEHDIAVAKEVKPLSAKEVKVEVPPKPDVPVAKEVKLPVPKVSRTQSANTVKPSEKRKRTDDDSELSSNIADVPQPKRFKAVALRKLPNLIKNLIKNEPETQYWKSKMESTTLFKIYNGCEEYQMITDHFTEYDNQNDYRILSVERIENPTLMASFVMKRQELEAMKPLVPVQTRLLFHATDYKATQGIISDNFDWRLAGWSRGHKYGHGTCFSPYSDWSTQFGHPDRNNVYYTLLCHVMERKSVNGHAEMIIPPLSYDTSNSRDGNVVVKYHDNTAYPAYRISYQKLEHYHDDAYMRRTEWAHDHRGNNYYQYNNYYSDYFVNNRAHQSNFAGMHDNYHHHYQRRNKKYNHRQVHRYTPY